MTGTRFKHSTSLAPTRPASPRRARAQAERPARASQRTRFLGTVCASLGVLLAGTACTLAFAAPPASPDIRLEVQNHASNGSDGFTNTTASNGATYSYRYSGGEGGGGDVVFRTRGRVTVNVHLGDGSSYAIDKVTFTGDAYHQLSWVSSSSASTTAVIQDRNDRVQRARYKVTVTDQASGVTVPCDPMIYNRGN